MDAGGSGFALSPSSFVVRCAENKAAGRRWPCSGSLVFFSAACGDGKGFSAVMTNQLAVSVQGVGKAYRIARNAEKFYHLSDAIMNKIKNPLQRVERETFWALRNIDFQIDRGECVGIIGRNGAGKSTLLKLLSRITPPSEGRIELYGRVGSLLEVGTGFHPELTGRENIFLNGAILGMRRSEIQREFDSIVEFAGVEKFLETPVKRYSSGMYVRLAFAVAAHLRTEILVVDEVLAVGDAEFQKKCLGKMQDVASGGRTVLFVSHNMHAVNMLCSRGIFLRQGGVVYDGTAEGAVDHYLNSFSASTTLETEARFRPGTGEYRVVEARFEKSVYDPDEPKVLRFKLERTGRPLTRLHLSFFLTDEKGVMVTQCDSRTHNFWMNDAPVLEGTFTLQYPWLKPGEYRVDLLIGSAGIIDKFDGAATLSVSPVLPFPASVPEDAVSDGTVFSVFEYQQDTSCLAAEPTENIA